MCVHALTTQTSLSASQRIFLTLHTHTHTHIHTHTNLHAQTYTHIHTHLNAHGHDTMLAYAKEYLLHFVHRHIRGAHLAMQASLVQ